MDIEKKQFVQDVGRYFETKSNMEQISKYSSHERKQIKPVYDVLEERIKSYMGEKGIKSVKHGETTLNYVVKEQQVNVKPSNILGALEAYYGDSQEAEKV